MNLFYANGTPIINSLKVTSEVPLDPRLTVENIAERDSLVTNHISYDRMKVYVKSNDTKYIYHKDTGEWEIDNKFSEEDKSKLDRIDNYLIDTEYIYNPENKLLYREHSYDPNTDITTLRDHILQEARVSENGELYNGLLSKFYVNRLNNITNYLIDVSFTKGTDVPNLYLTTHSYNPDEDKTTLTNIDIPLATDDNHGLLSNLQNIKVNRIVDYVNRIDTTHTNAPDTGLTYNYNIYNPFTNANVTKTILIPLVTHTENGLTSSSDKIKIDDIETYVKSIALRQASGTEELGIDYIITNPNDQTDTPGYFNIPLVTDSRNGLVSPARKHWMDNASGVSNTGTASDTWQLDKKDINTRLDPNGGVIIKDSGGVAEIRNSTDSAYSDLTLNNITIKGNVTQEGKSFITEAETVEIKYNTLLLNRGEVGSGVTKGVAGIEIDRGTEPKYQILFDESDDRFKVGREGDLWCVTLRDDDANMIDGMFTSWDASTKRLKTTNIIPSDQKISFGDNGDIELKYSLSKMGEVLPVTAPVLNIGRKGSNYPHIEFGLPSTHAVVYTDAPNGIYLQNQVLGRTFKRASDNSEVLYHADIINDLTTGGTNKVLSAEQGKLLQNSITSIQGSYLPLSGGTMTGSIRFPVGLGIVCEDVSGSAAYGVLRTWNYNGSTRMYVGTVNFPTYISSTASDLIHDRNGSSYLLWDSYNLLDPAKLSANQTFTGLNTFTEKIAVGSLTPSQILLDPSQEVVYRYASTEVSRGYSISLGTLNNIRKFTYGGYYSASKNDEYAYLSLPTQSWDTSSYKFYAVKLAIPKVWSLTDKTDDVITLTNSSTTFGRESTPLRLRGDNTDLIYYRGNNTYKIWDKFNLSDPATLSGNNTFTGNNTFQAGKFNVGSFKVASSGSLLVDINSQGMLAWSRNIMFRANSDNTSSSRFGGYNSTDNTSIGYAYIGIGDVDHSTAQYKFRPTSLTVPIAWSLEDPNGNALVWSQSSALVHLGRASGTTKIRSGNTDLIHTKGSTEYIIWDKSNLPTPATSTDLANYLPLIGGTLTGQLTIKQSIDIKLRLQSTDADNHCIIQAIDSQASQLGVFGYAGDKWAIGHNGTYYEIWDKYNLTDPVTYTTNAYNHATLKNKDGQYFTYIKAGTNGLLPHSQVTLTSGGSGSLGTSDQGFNAAYINHLYTNKISFGVNGPYIIGSTSATQFLDANGGVQKVATGGLYVGPSYASDALNLVPASGIYSQGNIRTSGWLTFEDNEWTDTGWAYKEAKGSIKVLSVINEVNNKPTSYGSVLQFNSRQGHWCTQIWCDQTNAAGVIGTLRFRTTKSYASTEWNPWTALVTTSDLNSYLTKTEASTLYYPYNGRGYLSITSTGKPVMSNNQGYAVKDKDGNEREVLWMGTNNALYLGNTSQYTLGQLDLRCTTLTHNGNKIATQNYVTNQLSNYLPLTGGTLSGNLTINTVGSTTFVINNNDTNGSETFMRVLRKGTASAAIGFRDSLGAYIYNYNSNKYLFIDNDGYARVGTTSGSTRLALITDIPTVSGYLPLTGGTLTGTLSINSGGSEPLIINNSASAGEAYVVTKTQGTTRGVMGWNSSLGMFLQDNRGYTFSVKADGVYFGASSSTLTKLPTSTDLSGYLPLAGGTLTGALTMSSRRHGVVIDVIGGAGNTWDEGVGALSVQVPNDAGQTPLLLARRSGAAIDTTTAAERLLSMELLDDGHSFIIGMSGSKALQLDWTSGKAGTGKLFGKTIATTDQIPSLSGYATTSDLNSLSGSVISVTTGTNYIPVNLPTAVRTSAGAKKYLEWYDAEPGWYNFRLGYIDANGTISATGNVTAPKFIGALQGNADTATTASKLGSTTIGGSAKPIYLSSGTPTACSATVGSTTVPVYMNAGTITQCSTTLGVSITGTAATATKWNGYSIWTGTEDELPSSRDANTLYFVKKS